MNRKGLTQRPMTPRSRARRAMTLPAANLALLIVSCFAASCFALVSAGCTVGSQYVKPSIAEPPVAAFKELQGWKAAEPSDELPRGTWWELFGDPQLNALEQQLIISNEDLKAADARFREARAMIRVNRSSEFPTVSTAPAAATTRNSGNTPISTSTLNEAATGVYTLPFDLTYEVDVWGRIRRTVAAAKEHAQVTAADLQTVNLSLQSELAFDYFELRSADAQKRLLDTTVNTYAEALQLTTNRFEGGAAAKSDVAQAKTQLDSTRVQATDLAVQRARFEHAIAVLVGAPPSGFSIPVISLGLVAPDIPTGLPSQLLERRSDVASAERRTAEANEQVGVARTAFFPTVLLSAALGYEGNQLSNWFDWPSRFWSIGPNVVQTIFDGGRRRAVSDAATANYDATVAAYRQSALTAFQQVEDNLAALRVLEEETSQQAEATASAQESLRIFTERYVGGLDPYLQVLTAQTIALANERNGVDIMRRRMDASVLLIKSLGGGWSLGDLPTAF